MIFFELLIGLISVAIAVVLYFKWTYKYWERRGVPHVEPRIPFGNGQNPFSQRLPTYEVIRRLYEQFKSEGHMHGGIYMVASCIYLPVDLDLIRSIMSKDFASFTDRGTYLNEKKEPLTGHLFSLEGQQWRNMRAKLTPTFTSGKMKMMFKTLLDCGDQLRDHVDKLNAIDEPLDIKDILASFTTDVIGSCAFGVECNSFKDPNSEFRRNGRKIFMMNYWRKIRVFFILSSPSFARKLGLRIFDPDVHRFFMGVVKRMADYREHNDVKRNDFMQLLLELKRSDDCTSDGLSMGQIAAQAFVFFTAGFETSSTTMTFCLFELTQNQEVQEKLRREVLAILEKHDGKLTYDGIMEMKYMGQVIDETLRKYPPVGTLFRKSVKDYVVPNTDVVLERSTRVFISALAIHYDPEIYPNPEKFDPDRFSDEMKATRHPYAFLPFGEGPRNCIGLRFGLMQTRVGLSLILMNYRLELSPKTELPLKLDPAMFLMSSVNKIWLDTKKIK